PKPSVLRPDLVVIKITPLPALDPYKAAAEAPFNTDMLAISSGLISPKPLPISNEGFQKSLFDAPVKLSIGTPSITIKGWLSTVSELNPRNTIFEELAGPPLPLTTCRPATLPVNALARFGSRA